jgi:hypothetical protein
MKTISAWPASPHASRPTPRSDHDRGLEWLVAVLLASGILPAVGAGKDDARTLDLSGVFLVCKEYGTVRGTFLADVRGKDVARLNFLFGEGVNPRFSPAADRILFVSARGGTPGLWRIAKILRRASKPVTMGI